ncbi:MAG: VWA domain-containing protein [Pyrinomonadaceae bacterium]
MNAYSRLILVAALFLVPMLAVSAQDPVATPPPLDDDKPETIFSEEIRVNVSAFDRFGNSVGDVTTDDLVIMEDGRILQPASVRRIPANVVLLLDLGGELRRVKNITNTRNTAKELVSKLTSDTNIAVVEYHDKARVLTDWTTDRKTINDDLQKKLIFGRRSVFSDGIELALTMLSKPDMENRHLVIISDGTDTIASNERRRALFTRLLGTNITVHVLSYTKMERDDLERSLKGGTAPAQKKALPQEVIDGLPNGVRDVANASGGITINTDKEFQNTMNARKEALKSSESFLLEMSESTAGIFLLPDDMDEMTERTETVAKAIDSSYLVTYVPKRPLAESPKGETRNIEVTSKKSGVFVEAKRKLVVGGTQAQE